MEVFKIEHSGRIWTVMAYDRGVPVWPIEEYLARRKHKPRVAERIRRLNPNGKTEGEMPRGIHWKQPPWLLLDGMPVQRFIKRYGREKYRSLPREAFLRRGHRKAIKGEAITEHCR